MKTLIAFAMVTIAFVVTGWVLTQQNNKTNHLVSENRELIRHVQRDSVSITQLRKANADSCKNFTTLKHAVNRFHGTIKSFLRAALIARIKLAEHSHGAVRALDLRTAHAYSKLLRNTRTVKASCAQRANKGGS